MHMFGFLLFLDISENASRMSIEQNDFMFQEEEKTLRCIVFEKTIPLWMR